AEVLARDEDLGALGRGSQERKARLRAPVGEQVLSEPPLVGALEEARRDDLVGVDVVLQKEHGGGLESLERGHGPSSVRSVRTSVMVPVTAAAAAVSGEASSVRPPLPGRPSKFRLLVLTAYCPASI